MWTSHTRGAPSCIIWSLLFQPHSYGTFPLQLDDVIGTKQWQYMSGQRRRATSTHSWARKLQRCGDTKWSCSCRDAKIFHRLLGKHGQLACGLVEVVMVGELGGLGSDCLQWLDVGNILGSAHLMGNVLFDLHLRKWRRSLCCCLDAHDCNSLLFVTVGALCPTPFTLHMYRNWTVRDALLSIICCTDAHPDKMVCKNHNNIQLTT